MPIIIIGGILGGFFTATECGVIATLYGIAYGLKMCIRDRLYTL